MWKYWYCVKNAMINTGGYIVLNVMLSAAAIGTVSTAQRYI